MIDLACCGCRCDTCPAYTNSCAGCNALAGKPEWVDEFGFHQCAFYTCCVVEKGLSHCGQCREMPCALFYEYNDPSQSQEQLDQWLALRISELEAAQKRDQSGPCPSPAEKP